MLLIAGLGNFGPEYEGTRHNMGFEVVDILADDLNLSISRAGFQGVYAKGEAYGEQVMILKPMTYMNLSGNSVVPAMRYYKVPLENLIVVCDDMAILPGQFRPRTKGSSGGQKGLQNIIDMLGTDEFKRIRIGTGEPPRKSQTVDYVLGKPNKSDREKIDAAIDEAVKFLHLCIKDGYQRAMDAVSRNLIRVDSNG